MAEENVQQQQTQAGEGQAEEVNEMNAQQQQADATPETAEKTNGGESEKTFTQAELDEIIAKRIERERNKYADYEEIRKKAEQYEKEAEERRLAEMSEKERAEELAKKYEEEKSELARQLNELKSQIQQEKINNAFIKAAQAANIEYVDDALKLADLSAVEVDEDGKVNGVQDVIDSLIENKPFLLAQQKPKRSVGEPTNNGGERMTDKTAEQMLKEAEDKAKKTGRIEDRMAAAKLRREIKRF